jgi:hypothetical protein
MSQLRFRCRNCGKVRRRRTSDQRFCGDRDCQRARKNAWRREKYATDSDYKLNQRASSRAWFESVGGSADYFRRYRQKKRDLNTKDENQECCEMPTCSDRQRRRANSDAKTANSFFYSGRYRLFPCGSANSDAILVDIAVIPDG